MDNYEHQKHVQEYNRTRWRCRWHNKLRCKAILYTTGKNIIVNTWHNHQADNIDCSNMNSSVFRVVFKK